MAWLAVAAWFVEWMGGLNQTVSRLAVSRQRFALRMGVNKSEVCNLFFFSRHQIVCPSAWFAMGVDTRDSLKPNDANMLTVLSVQLGGMIPHLASGSVELGL